MKNLSFILLLNLILLLILTSCSTTFDGYSYNIDDARNHESSYYDEYDHIFTAENDGYLIDFLVCGEQLHIIKFDIKEQGNTTLYKIKNRSIFSINEALAYSKSENSEDWTKTGNLPFQVEWSIVEKNIETPKGFEFTYNNTECVLLYRISN